MMLVVRRGRGFIIALGFACCAGAAWAGGGSFGQDDDANDQNAGPAFFGFVKDKSGDVIDDAKITVTVKNVNSTMILRTDSQGHFFFKGFDKSIDPGDITVVCSKDGYREVAHTRKPSLDAAVPIEVDCILERS
jgi:hypothetical protein